MGEKLKIWVVSIIEPLPIERETRLLRYGKLTRYLAERGHQVTLWSSGFSHAPKKHIVSETQTQKLSPNLTLHILKGLGYSRNVSWQRVLHQRDFAKQFLQDAKLEEIPDIIITPIPTLETAAAVATYVTEKDVPFLLDIRDSWPQEFVNLLPKFLRGLGAVVFQSWFELARFSCERATAITGISTDCLNYGLSLASREITEMDRVFPSGYICDQLPPEQKVSGERWLQSLNINENETVVCFFGTIGRFFDLDTVIKAAEQLQDRPIRFILGGVGDSLEKYKNRSAHLKNVIFPGWLKDAQIQAVMKRASVGIAPYKYNASMTMPNKPFEYMAGRLALLVSFRGELCDQILANNSGLYYQANQPLELVSQLMRLIDNPELCKKMGENAKALYEQHYSLDIIFPKFENYICEIAATRSFSGHLSGRELT